MNFPQHPQNPQDIPFLERSLALAVANVTQGDGGPFGAVIVKDGQIIAEARNQVVARHDPTAHAEVLAIRAACATLGNFHLQGCTLYASSEPCPMCLAAAWWAQVDRIVYANDRGVAATIGFSDDAFYEQFKLPKEARRVPMLHHPIPGAEQALLAWQAHAERVRY